ncbi:16S rRNA (uracil(1498)-N(3))-methyltransferase, partial [Desulfobacula sp.]
DNEFLSYSLGPRILRAETASISSCTIIQHILGDI